MPALRDEAAADEDHGRHLEEMRELTHRVEDDDVSAGLRIDGEVGAADHAKPLALRERLCLAESLRLAWGNDQKRVWVGPAHNGEGFEHGTLFVLERAGCNEDGTRGRDAEVSAAPVPHRGRRPPPATRASRTSGCP